LLKNGNLASAGPSGSIRIWDIKRRHCLKKFGSKKDYVYTKLFEVKIRTLKNLF